MSTDNDVMINGVWQSVDDADYLRVTILANGSFPTHEVPLTVLENSDFVVCCDAAVVTLMQHGYHFATDRVQVVGDLDSMPAALRGEVPYPIFNETEQDDNDLTKAFRWLCSHLEGPKLITILAATGLREDHTLGNISLLMDYHKRLSSQVATDGRRGRIRMVSDYGVFTPVVGRASFSSFVNQQVSIFSLTPGVPVTLEGLQYPLEGQCLTSWWQGTLNNAMGDSFAVEGGDLIVYQTHEAK